MTAAERQARGRETQQRQAQAKRMRAECVDPSKLRAAKQYFTHLRVAYKLLRVFPHDEDTHDVAAKYMGSIAVPRQLEANFQLEDVADDRYGFDARYRMNRNMAVLARPVVAYTVERRRHDVAVVMHEVKGARYRMRSQSSTRRCPSKTRPGGRGRSGSRSVEPSKRARAQSQGLNMRPGEALALAKRGEAITVPEPPKATDAGVEIKSITENEFRAGIVVDLSETTDNKEGPSPLSQGQMRVFAVTHKWRVSPTRSARSRKSGRDCSSVAFQA